MNPWLCYKPVVNSTRNVVGILQAVTVRYELNDVVMGSRLKKTVRLVAITRLDLRMEQRPL